ncbi:CD209 antigen-like protein E isoform X2 [Lepisosteus oculatus]|uniref:CD209 antigen-like protein E isoform X2 n=1 Tax=Lepisosteus oculatus TaxID=7918 RepID=UPI0035F50623
MDKEKDNDTVELQTVGKTVENEYSVPHAVVKAETPDQTERAGPPQVPVYTGLEKSSENVYSTVDTHQLKPTATKGELEKKVTLFRRVSLGLGVLCLLLLIAVAGLCVKALHPEPCASPEAQTDITLMTQRSSNKKSEIDQPGDGSVMDCQGGLCHLCRKGWLFFDGSCYFFSRDRLTWQESVEDCSRQKAELLVIASEKVQDFVTKKGTLFYWIGLQRDSSGTWAWINGDKLTVGYWVTPETPGASRESCVALKGRDDNRHNWNTANCEFNAFRVCRHTPRLPSN